MQRSPLRDDSAILSDERFRNGEVASEEECRDCSTEKHRPEDAVEEEEDIIGLASEQIAFSIAILVAHSLNDKAEENEHPHPIGTTEAGGIEQRERSEESTTKHYKSGEGEFPAMSHALDHLLAL